MKKIETISELRKICQPPSKRMDELHLIVVRFFRVFSIYITWLILRTKITPNQLTVAGIFLVITAPFLFLLHDHTWMLIGVFLFLFGYVLDYCDGEVARYHKTDGKVGLWFMEPATHDIQYGLTTIPLGIAAYQLSGNICFLILGFSGSLAKLLTRTLETRFQAMRLLRLQHLVLAGKKDVIKKHKANYVNNKQLYAKVYETFFTTSSFAVTVPLAALTGRYDIFTWFYGVSLTLIFFVYLIRLYFKMQPYLREKL